MLTSNLYICSEDAIRYRGRPALPPADGHLRGTGALNRFYAARDGWVFLCCPTDAEWQRLCAMLERPQWADDPRFADPATRTRFGDQLIAAIAPVLAARATAELEALGAAHEVACVELNAAGGGDFFLHHPQSTGNQFVVEAGHPGIPAYARAGCAAAFSLTPGTARVAHPFGHDGPAILAELGYPEPDIDKWLASGLLVRRETAGR
jgi:crotonobetainyl-CoA:carnitine CoA-transferase CaiB-like acyl-CoA transferase